MTVAERVEILERALKIISVWAETDLKHKGRTDGVALTPELVADLCERALRGEL
jgi:hypothetical protein